MLSKVKAVTNVLRTRRLSKSQKTPPIRQNSQNSTSALEFSNYQRRTEKNEEDITIVWLSKNVTNVEEQVLIESLRSINDYVQAFDNEEDALACIELIVEEKVLLIVDELSDHLRSVLDALKQVDALLLYTAEPPVVVSAYVSTICSTEEQLIEEVKCIRQQLSKQMAVFSVYNQQKQEKHNLTHEASSFLFFQLFKAAFRKLPKNSESKKMMISKCRNYYKGNGKVLDYITNFEQNYKSSDALRWYTYDSFIYRIINKALRTENINALYHFHFYIVDLSTQLEKEFSKYKKQDPRSTLLLYRGLKITREDVKNFEKNVGNLVLTNGYLSTTRKRELAYNVAMKKNTQMDYENVLFEYTVDLTTVKTTVFADISSYNVFPDENEILFDLGTAFKIKSCTYNEVEDLWLVNVSATDQGVDVASEYIEYQKAKMTESNIMLMFGHLIIEMGNYDKAEKYFETLLNSSNPNDEEIACIYYNIGRVYRLKGEHERALEFLNLAYMTHSDARPARLVSAAKAMNAIGIVYMEQNNVQPAIDAFDSALKLYTKTIQGYHPDVGGTLINLGNIYCEQEQFLDALSCFKRAQKIYECNLPANHPNIAVLLNNMGNLYYRQYQLDLALDAYQRALDINEKILPPNHPVITRNMNNLSKVHMMICDHNKPKVNTDRPPDYSLFATNTFIESEKNNIFPFEVVVKSDTSDMELIEMVEY